MAQTRSHAYSIPIFPSLEQTQFFEPLDQLLLNHIFLALVKISCAQINVFGAPFNQVISNHQNGVSDRNRRALFAPSGS